MRRRSIPRDARRRDRQRGGQPSSPVGTLSSADFSSLDTARGILKFLLGHPHGIDEVGRRSVQNFFARWVAFNAVYGSFHRDTERDQLILCITEAVQTEQAQALLDRLPEEIAFLAHLPPGDMRPHIPPARFRSRAAADMAIVADPTRPSAERLARLVAVVYQVRCNLFHGRKNLGPAYPRNRELLEIGDRILRAVLDELVP